MRFEKLESIAIAPAAFVPVTASAALSLGLLGALLIIPSQLLVPAFAQTKPAVELEGAIAKEQVDGDLRTAIAIYLKISADTSASRDVRAKALLHLAACYEKLGQQARKLYEQIVRDFADQPAAAQARAWLARYSTRQVSALKEMKPERLTANTPELTIETAAISPDGKSIAYSDPLGIHVRSVATGETRLVPGTRDHMLVQWMPDGNSLQTHLQDAATGTTMIVSLQGGTPAPALNDPFVGSPDRAHRALVSADHRQLSIQDANGENSRVQWRAASGITLDQLQWSPNGTQIAVLSSKDNGQGGQGASTLELIEIGSRRKNVLIPAERNLELGSIVWPSQNRVIVAIDEELGVNQYDSNLWEIRLNGDGAMAAGGLRRLTAWTDFPIRSGSLSADGKRLVFIRSFQQRDVYVAPLEAGGTRMGTPRRLTLDLGDDYPTDWTRDSKTVILTSSRNGPPAIFRQDLDKQTADQIVVMPRKSGNQLVARVTPDGNSVLFRNWDPTKKIAQLMRAPIGGGTPEAVTNAENVGNNYRCASAGVCVMAQRQGLEFIVSELDPVKGKGREIYRARQVENLWLSPDGKWIADTSESRLARPRSFSGRSRRAQSPGRFRCVE